MQQRKVILQSLGRDKSTPEEAGESGVASQGGDPAARGPARRGTAATGPSIKAAGKGGGKTKQVNAAAREKVEAFGKVLEERRDICWEDLVPEFRENYYDAYDEMADALFSTDDPLVVYNVVRYADFSKPQEVAAHAQFIAECDAEKHQVSLRALARKKVPELLKALQARQDLPDSVREAINETEEQPKASSKRKRTKADDETKTEDGTKADADAGTAADKDAE